MTPDEALGLPWDALRPFAGNPFMTPSALQIAAEASGADIRVLAAWDGAVTPARLVGLWALQVKSLAPWRYLDALPFDYAFLSTPVVDPSHAAAVMPAFMAAIAADPGLPPTLLLREFDASGEVHAALEALTGHLPSILLQQSERPIATRDFGLKRSGSTRKKLRQDWNRLAAEGAVEVDNARAPTEVIKAFEAFLALEAASWKGTEGTALLSKPGDAAFARRLIAEMASHGTASVALLRFEGRPIATQVLLYSGRTAMTWKTSYDSAFARFSPGTLLVDRIATELLDNERVDLVDSCALSDSFMGQLFAGRKPMVDLVMCATPRPSAAFAAVSTYFRLRVALKAWRDRSRRPRRAEGGTTIKRPARPPAVPEASSRGSTADRAA